MKAMRLSARNLITLPVVIRSTMKLSSGDQLVVARVNESEVVLKKTPTLYDFLGTATSGQGDPVERIRKLRDDWR